MRSQTKFFFHSVVARGTVSPLAWNTLQSHPLLITQNPRVRRLLRAHWNATLKPNAEIEQEQCVLKAFAQTCAQPTCLLGIFNNKRDVVRWWKLGETPATGKPIRFAVPYLGYIKK